jgi:hypothetical protein
MLPPALGHLDGLRRLFRNEGRARARLAQGRHHDLVSPHIELLDLVTSDVGSARIAELITKRGVGQLLGDDGGDGADAADDRGHAAGLLPGGEEGLLLGQVRLQCHL